VVLVEVLSALLVYLSIERDESEEDTVANVLLLHSGLNKTVNRSQSILKNEKKSKKFCL